jgi:hypothetical protein
MGGKTLTQRGPTNRGQGKMFVLVELDGLDQPEGSEHTIQTA